MGASAITGAVMVGTQIAGGLMSADAQREAGRAQQQIAIANAENARQIAYANANMTEMVGMTNALSAGSAGVTNAMMKVMSSQMTTDSLLKVSAYNMALQRATTEMNLSLLADELPKLFDEADLALTQIWQEEARREGSLRAYQAASGTVLDEGSNKDVIVDSRTQALMDAAIVGLQYKWNVEQVYDAMAKSAWEGQQAINKMAFEANVQASNIKSQAALDAFGELANASLQQWQLAVNAEAQATTQRNQGIAAYNQYISQGNAAMTTADMRAENTLINTGLNILNDQAGNIGKGINRLFTPNSAPAGGNSSLLTSESSASPMFNEIMQSSNYAIAEGIF